MESTQITFDGEEAPSREVPDTFTICRECGERMLRSQVQQHTHTFENGGSRNAIRYTVDAALTLGLTIDVDPIAADPDMHLEEAVRREAKRQLYNKADDLHAYIDILEEEPVSLYDANPVSL